MNGRKNIILIGFMGSGKSSVARELAKKVHLPVVEMDELIVERSKRKSVNDIFRKDGEVRFRELEVEVANGLHSKDGMVISTGGGVVMNGIIIEYLKTNGKVVFLDTSFETICSRLQGDASRPKFQDKDAARALYELRLPLYKEYADRIISTEGKAPQELAEAIVSEYANQ